MNIPMKGPLGAGLLVVGTLLAASSPEPVQPRDVIGKWVHHERWQRNEATWATRALVLRFCPDGTFLKVQGALYRTRGSTELGPSDGLEIWRGTWTLRESQLEARFKLVDAEIPFTGMAEAMKTEVVAGARFKGNHLEFDFPAGKRILTTRFSKATVLHSPLSDRFLECTVKSQPEALK